MSTHWFLFRSAAWTLETEAQRNKGDAEYSDALKTLAEKLIRCATAAEELYPEATAEEVVALLEKPLRLLPTCYCFTCDGRKVSPDSNTSACPECQGRGHHPRLMVRFEIRRQKHGAFELKFRLG